jgi:hypothetical protein
MCACRQLSSVFFFFFIFHPMARSFNATPQAQREKPPGLPDGLFSNQKYLFV